MSSAPVTGPPPAALPLRRRRRDVARPRAAAGDAGPAAGAPPETGHDFVAARQDALFRFGVFGATAAGLTVMPVLYPSLLAVAGLGDLVWSGAGATGANPWRGACLLAGAAIVTPAVPLMLLVTVPAGGAGTLLGASGMAAVASFRQQPAAGTGAAARFAWLRARARQLSA